jgi:hypothetical protein
MFMFADDQQPNGFQLCLEASQLVSKLSSRAFLIEIRNYDDIDINQLNQLNQRAARRADRRLQAFLQAPFYLRSQQSS